MQDQVVILSGFSQDQVVALMRAVRGALPGIDPAFAMTTPSNLEWKLSELIEHVGEEHRHFKAVRASGAPPS